MAAKTTTSRRVLIAALGAFVLLGAAIDLWRRRAASPAGENAVRLTTGADLATEPALSPDGKLLAWSSDRGGRVLDLWVQPVAGGAARRVTSGDADSHSPAFSHDGARIAFRSEAGEGGVYSVPASGGQPVPVAPEGRDPRFSPDGKWLAWWVSRAGGRSELHLAPAGGGAPRRLCPDFRAAHHPVWSPDSRHLLFAGQDGRGRREWFVVPPGGGEPIRTGADAYLDIQGFRSNVFPSAWVDDQVWFAGHFGRNSGVWRLALAPAVMQVTAGARQVTPEGAGATHVAAAGGAVAYAAASVSTGVWTLPLDPATSAATGDPAEIARADDGIFPQLSVSADGRRVLYRRKESHSLKEIDGGRETAVKAGGPALLSPDGTRVVYAEEGQFFTVPAAGGEPKRICRHCRELCGWSADGERVLFAQHGAIALAYPSSGERRDVLRYPKAELGMARFSPDGRWIAVQMRRYGSPDRQIWIAPYREGPLPGENEWIAISEEADDARHPCWSADGLVVYYLSGRDGFRCIWGRRLDRSTRRPRGDPFPVRHFHNARRTLADPRNAGEMALAAARGRLVFVLHETTGAIWRLRGR